MVSISGLYCLVVALSSVLLLGGRQGTLFRGATQKLPSGYRRGDRGYIRGGGGWPDAGAGLYVLPEEVIEGDIWGCKSMCQLTVMPVLRDTS